MSRRRKAVEIKTSAKSEPLDENVLLKLVRSREHSPQMTGAAVKRIYERRPYPDPRRVGTATRRWQLPPLPWIHAIWQPRRRLRRILVAGCGTGIEAFALQR